MVRLMSLSLAMHPSTMPLLMDQVRPLRTASLSFSTPAAKDWSSGRVTPLHLLKPGIQTLSGAGAHHLDELLNQISGLVDFWMELKELAKRLLLLDVEFFRATQQKESRLPRGGEGRYLC